MLYTVYYEAGWYDYGDGDVWCQCVTTPFVVEATSESEAFRLANEELERRFAEVLSYQQPAVYVKEVVDEDGHRHSET